MLRSALATRNILETSIIDMILHAQSYKIVRWIKPWFRDVLYSGPKRILRILSDCIYQVDWSAAMRNWRRMMNYSGESRRVPRWEALIQSQHWWQIQTPRSIINIQLRRGNLRVFITRGNSDNTINIYLLRRSESRMSSNQSVFYREYWKNTYWPLAAVWRRKDV